MIVLGELSLFHESILTPSKVLDSSNPLDSDTQLQPSACTRAFSMPR